MVWLLIYYFSISPYATGLRNPVQMPHEFTSKAECERAAQIINNDSPSSGTASLEHLCLGVTHSH